LTPGATRSSVACGHAFIEHLFNTERRNHFLDTRNRHLQFAIETAIGGKTQRARGDRDQIALLNPGLHDLDMAAGGLDFHGTAAARVLAKNPAARSASCARRRRTAGVEQRMQPLHAAARDLQHGLDHGMIERRAFGQAAVQFDVPCARKLCLRRSI